MMGPELAITMQKQNLRAELSYFCETIRSVLGRGQENEIECKELLGWEQGKEEMSCLVEVPHACLSNMACQGWPRLSKISVQQEAL